MRLIRKKDFQKERTNIVFQKLMAFPSSITTLFIKRGPKENYSEFDILEKQSQNLIDTMDIYIIGSLTSFVLNNKNVIENNSFLSNDLMEIIDYMMDKDIIPALCALAIRYSVGKITEYETVNKYVKNIKNIDIIDKKYNINNFKNFNLAYAISYMLDTLDSIPNKPIGDDGNKKNSIKKWLDKISESVKNSLYSNFNQKKYINLKIEFIFLPHTAINIGKKFINKLLNRNIFDIDFNSKNEFLKSRNSVEDFIDRNKDIFLAETIINRKNNDQLKIDITKQIDEIYRISYEMFIEQSIKLSFAYELSKYIKGEKSIEEFKKFAQLDQRSHFSYNGNFKFQPYGAISNISRQIIDFSIKETKHPLYYKFRKILQNDEKKITDHSLNIVIHFLKQEKIMDLKTFNEILNDNIEKKEKIINKKRIIYKNYK